MDPLSLTLSLITAFKEVYLVSKFIYHTMASARHSDTERESLRKEFRFEFLFVQSFGQYFLKGKGLVNNADQDPSWMEVICDIFERLRMVCSDYARIAADQDPEYKKYSPYLNEKMFNTKVIEFNINEVIPPVAKDSMLTATMKRMIVKTVNLGDSWKWALFERRKMERVVHNYQELNKKLKDVIPLTLWTHLQNADDKSQALHAVIKDENAVTLGLAPLAELGQIIVDPDSNENDFRLTDCILHAAVDRPTPTVGSLQTQRNGKSFNVPEKVLVEFKENLSSDGQADLDETVTLNAKTDQRVRQLASLLASAGSHDLRTLPLKGFLDQPDQKRHAFVFQFPTDVGQAEPISLHSIIESRDPSHRLSLSSRFNISQVVAHSVGVFHAAGWVHKSIHSKSIVFFQHRASTSLAVESPYLVNFEYSRPESAMTLLRNDNADELDLYLHPDRRIGGAKMAFQKVHDLYALGVVLLEIAVWRTARDIYNEALSHLEPGSKITDRDRIQRLFIQVAQTSIPHRMGNSFLNAVLACLHCKFEGQPSRSVNFPMVFRKEVVQQLGSKGLES